MNPAASYPLSAPSVSRRLDPGEWWWIMSSAALRSARPAAWVRSLCTIDPFRFSINACPMKHRTAPVPGGLVNPRVRIGDRSMRRVRALLTLEVDLGVAVAVCRASHRFGFVLGLSRLGVGGDILCGRITGPLIVGRRARRLRLETRHQGPSLDQRAVDRKVLVRKRGRDHSMGQDRRHHLARHLCRHQPVAVLCKDRRHRHGIVHA